MNINRSPKDHYKRIVEDEIITLPDGFKMFCTVGRLHTHVDLESIPDFKEGDWAFSFSYGWGKLSMENEGGYPIKFYVAGKCVTDFTMEGKIVVQGLYRNLFTALEAKLLFGLEPPKEKDELDIMLEKAIEFYGTDVLKKGTELLPKNGWYYKVLEDISFTEKKGFYINCRKLCYNFAADCGLAFSADGEFRPIVLGYSNDKEPKPLTDSVKCWYVTEEGLCFETIAHDELIGCFPVFISKEEANEYAKTLRKVKVEITEAEYEMIKSTRNDSKTL